MRILLTAIVFTALTAHAQQTPIPLYPDGIPNAKKAPAGYTETTDRNSWITKVTEPRLVPFFPEAGKANGAAVVICPGGSYAGLASSYEGTDVARAFASKGITAFVLIYRLPSDAIMIDPSIGPLQDAQTAILTLRKNAAQWHLDPKKIGIMGFSAGGHLASTEGTHFDHPVIDDKEQISLRPDFMLLIYPVIDFGEYTHQGSRENLIGKTLPADKIELYSNQKQITANTPPAFLVHAEDDSTVPVQNSLLFYEALLKNKVKTEMHLYQQGGHGFGMNNPKNNDKWFDMAVNWLEENGYSR